MANIELKRGQKAQVDITFKNSAGTTVNFSSNHTASLTLRKDSASGSVTGEEVDSLTTTNNRITLVHGPSASPATTDNIQLKWSTVQASALPNEALTLIGDLKITDTQPNPDEVIHSFRLTFDIIPEII
jgi:guanyl-specific ribonuclease Sa